MKSFIEYDGLMIGLAERRKRTKSQSEFKRIQCVLIRATLGSSAGEFIELELGAGSGGAVAVFGACR